MTRLETVQERVKLEVTKKSFIKAVDAYIQNTIDTYNKDNGVLFTNIYNCIAYIGVDTYEHQQFCIDVVNWNAAVWSAARALELDIISERIAIPSTDEFITLLPTYGE